MHTGTIWAQELRDLIARENIGSEVSASDSKVSSNLEGTPPFRADEGFAVEPVPNKLLANLAWTGGGKSFRESGLRACDCDCAVKRCNVVLLHAESVSRNLECVNKSLGLTGNNEACTVLPMPTTKRKAAHPAVRGKVRADGEVGADGLTLAQRLMRLMTERGITQAELARMCSKYYGSFIQSDDDAVKQQHIFNILNGQDSSWVLPLISIALDVSDLWLQFGIGHKERAHLKN
jgi:hypothetical protein